MKTFVDAFIFGIGFQLACALIQIIVGGAVALWLLFKNRGEKKSNHETSKKQDRDLPKNNTTRLTDVFSRKKRCPSCRQIYSKSLDSSHPKDKELSDIDSCIAINSNDSSNSVKTESVIIKGRRKFSNMATKSRRKFSKTYKR